MSLVIAKRLLGGRISHSEHHWPLCPSCLKYGVHTWPSCALNLCLNISQPTLNYNSPPQPPCLTFPYCNFHLPAYCIINFFNALSVSSLSVKLQAPYAKRFWYVSFDQPWIPCISNTSGAQRVSSKYWMNGCLRMGYYIKLGEKQ